jgi:isopentenyl-diphosphate delta-isomerase
MNDDEIFVVYDKSTQKKIGEKRRGDVHRDGDLHCSVSILLFNNQGQLLMQRRSSTKDICPGMWDISCAEHLKPGETYLDAARRGLSEELGITNVHLIRFREENEKIGIYPNVIDHELTECWKCIYNGDFVMDLEELSQIKFFEMDSLPDPKETTPWFQSDWDYYQKSNHFIEGFSIDN